ncbi:MucB/RseB C-terminal domain-containing protein [Marinobacter sp.]|uniref:MucB/RseB C-terminal domain-containing protein n=1 Tax=Marinobacter sp. TaxID=50741 RepID=UPI00384D52AD
MRECTIQYLHGLILMAILLAGPPVAQAGQPETAGGWLQRMGPAMDQTTYRGVFVYSRGEQVSSMQVAHRYHDGQVEERLVQQDGASGEILRKGNRIFCVLPDHGQVQLDQFIPSAPFAEPFSRKLMPDSRWYAVSMRGTDRVAGHDTVQIALDASDAHRYSYRVWLEQDTALLVKSHVQDAAGRVLEQFQFTSLEIRESLPDSEFELQSTGPEVERWSLTPGDSARAARLEGWTLNWKPDGFVPAAKPRSAKRQAVAFSDGLAAFSVFVESTGAQPLPPGASRIGATTAYMRHVSSDDHAFLITVVGEIPPATAMRVAESVDVDPARVAGNASDH